MPAELIRIKWENRLFPLAPVAMIAFGRPAAELAIKLWSFDDARLRTLQGVSAQQMIMLLGEPDTLPWTDGAIYLGRDAQMRGFLLPTTVKPAIAFDIFERIINEKYKHLAPFAVMPEKVISHFNAKSLAREVLEKWLSENQ